MGFISFVGEAGKGAREPFEAWSRVAGIDEEAPLRRA